MADQTPDNLPAVQAIHPDRRALMNPDTDSWVVIVQQVATLAAQIAETTFVPKGLRGSPPSTAAAILYGREVGLAPMTSLSGIYVADGKPAMYAEQMRAMILAAGHEIDILTYTAAKCVMRGKRKGSDRWSPEVEWNLDHARQAGLINKENWRKDPRSMLFARCTTALGKMWFPDVLHGMRSAEELQDEGEAEAAAPVTTTSKVARGRALPPAPPPSPMSTPDGAVPADTAPGGPDAPPAPLPGPAAAISPSGPPPPPLPGEPGYGDTGGAATIGASAAPPDPGTGDGTDLAAGAPAHAGTVPPPSPPASETVVTDGPSPTDDQPASRGALRALHAAFRTLGYRGDEDRAERLAITRAISGENVATSEDLTHAGALKVMNTLAKFQTRADVGEFMTGLVAAGLIEDPDIHNPADQPFEPSAETEETTSADTDQSDQSDDPGQPDESA